MTPRLTVVVPTFNRARVLAKCLRALSRQDCGAGDIEVIVADDGSADETRKVCESFDGNGLRLGYLYQPNTGANAARNRAIASARGALILLINDDTIATPQMIRAHLAAHDQHPDDRIAVLGRVTVSPDVPASRLAPLHLDRAFASLADRRELDWTAFYTCNVSVKKSLLDRGGAFEERLRYHEDLELAERLSHHGLTVVYRPEALGFHEHCLTEDEFFAIAAREARALATWSRLSPHVTPRLAPLGFEPAQPVGRRARHRLVELAINPLTFNAWRHVARRCPIDRVSLRLYDQMYQCRKRSHLRRELRHASAGNTVLPPGPQRRFPGAMLIALRRGPLDFMMRLAREHGDVAYYRVGPHRVFLLSHPDFVKDVLVTQEARFSKGRGFERAKRLFGNGLLTSEGAFHLRQRRLAQPAFHRARVQAYGDVMSTCAESECAGWHDAAAFDIHEAMRRVTLAIAGRTLFGADLATESEELGAALTDALRLFETVTMPFGDLVDKLPFGTVKRFEAARARLDDTVHRIIRNRRAAGAGDDLLSLLLRAQDVDGATGAMTDEQLRDECMTMFLAGHETTANALAWTWYLLSQHPDLQGRAQLEVDEAVGARTPTGADYTRLPYLDQIVSESLRLYPPAWMIDRRVIDGYRVAGYEVPRDAIVVVSPFVIHRDPRFFPDPLRFDPDRWTAEARAAQPRHAYFPFGGGTRQCIGEGFARMSTVLVLATVLRQWTISAAHDQRADMRPMVTLRPRHGIRVIARKRR